MVQNCNFMLGSPEESPSSQEKPLKEESEGSNPIHHLSQNVCPNLLMLWVKQSLDPQVWKQKSQ